ncbi:MAG: CpsB/CapC family capsule biosynthesis tyrosine phosphatase [Planctomycetota bacterium]
MNANAFVDVHCHLLAGLDDGPATSAEALAMCRDAADHGTSVLAATVHQMGSHFHNSREVILRATEKLAAELLAHGIPVRVHPNAEWMIDSEWVEAPQRYMDSLLTINDNGRYALIEFPYHPPRHTALIVQRLAERGIRPVLAHVDRFPGLLSYPVEVRRLIDEGFYIQINADAIDGRRGSPVRRASRTLLLSGLIHLVASDGHDPIRRPPRLQTAFEVVKRWLGNTVADQLFCFNPAALLEGRPLEIVASASWWRRFRRG